MNQNILIDEEANLLEGMASLLGLGETLQSAELRERFCGVREDILREIRGGMCTVDQGYAYLENFELRLLAEQWEELEGRPQVA